MKKNEYKRLLIAAHLGWWSTITIVTLRAVGVAPISYGLVALLTLGLGVTASLSLSRMRLGKTITEVFNTGMRTAITLSANIFTDTCIMVLNREGQILAVDHCDAIGWNCDEILGRNLVKEILCPRSGMSGEIRKLEPGTTLNSPMRNQDGGVFDARLSIARLNQATLDDVHHDRLVVTIAPIVAPTGDYKLHS